MKKVAQKIANAGGRLYLVGGAVRDSLLGFKPKDKDYCLTGLDSKEVLNLFPKAQQVGKDFGVFLINGNEVALARTEKKDGKGHTGFLVNTHKVSLKEDLRRRDLTINAIAKDVLNGKIVDPFKGQKDLKKGFITNTSEKFIEDPLRVYRVARFAARYGFNIDGNLFLICRAMTMTPEFNTLSKDRVFDELRKGLSDKNPDLFIKYLQKLRVLKAHFPELDKLASVPEMEEYHVHDNSLDHTILTLKNIKKLNDKQNIRFAMLMHDIGKLNTQKHWPHHYGHAKIGLNVLDSIASKNKFPNKWIRSAQLVIRNHMKMKDWDKLKPGTIVKLFVDIKKSPLSAKDFIDCIKADNSRGSGGSKDYQDFLDLYQSMFKTITGDLVDMDKFKGPQIGQRLHQLRCQYIAKKRQG